MSDPRASPGAQLVASLARFPPEVRALAKRGLAALRRALPGATRLVYDYRDSLVVAFGASDRGHEAILSLAIAPRGVRLYVRKGVPDPERRLQGAGTQVRSVPLEAASELDRGAVRALIEAAIRHAGATVPRGRSGRTVFKSATKRRTPTKRPARS